MRIRVLTIVLAIVSVIPAGCATGFRVGGNHYGAGIGGYVGPVPDGGGRGVVTELGPP